MTIAIPMVIVLIIIAPWAFGFFFGKGWETAGIYVRILAPMFGVRLIVSGLAPSMIISKKQVIDLIIQILFTLGTIIIFFVCLHQGNIEVISFITIISILFSTVYILYFLIMFKFTKEKKRGN